MLPATVMFGNSAYAWKTMPTLRWFGGRCVMSAPSSGSRPRSATRSRRSCAGSWSCRSRSGRGTTRTRRARPRRSKFCTPTIWANASATPSISRNAIRLLLCPSPPIAWPARRGRRPMTWIERHAPPGDGEGDDRERRRLVGAVGADELQVRTEGRPVQQARHGELADDDGEGQERAAQDGDPHIGEDDPEQHGRASWPPGSGRPPSGSARRSRAGRCRPPGTCRAATASRSCTSAGGRWWPRLLVSGSTDELL